MNVCVTVASVLIVPIVATIDTAEEFLATDTMVVTVVIAPEEASPET